MLKKVSSVVKKIIHPSEGFSSKNYWESRYNQGGNSGAGSYDHLAVFKAEVLNQLFKENGLTSVIEFGCGDGNQLGMLECPSYTGLDVSATAIQRCKTTYAADSTKNFFLYDHRCFVDNRGIFKMDCSLSLDVLYHLVEKEVYDSYLRHLFASASKMVVIYAADIAIEHPTAHELYRKFTKDVEKDIKGWKLKTTIKNKYPAKNNDDQEGSLADFFIYVPA
jgi:hypothetical protein